MTQVSHPHPHTYLEGCDDKLEAMGISAPRVGPVLEGDKVGSREEDPFCPKGVDGLFARQVRL